MAGTAAGAARAAETRRQRQRDRGGDDAALPGIEPTPGAVDDGPAPQRIGDDGAATTPAKKSARASFPADEAGDIATEELTPAARDRLARAARKLQLVVGNNPADDAIDPVIVAVLYDALGSIAASICVGLGYTLDSARMMAFNDEEKKMVVPLSAKLLAKYAGNMGRWQDEIALGVTLYAIIQSKAAKLEKRPKPTEVINFPAAPSPEAAQ